MVKKKSLSPPIFFKELGVSRRLVSYVMCHVSRVTCPVLSCVRCRLSCVTLVRFLFVFFLTCLLYLSVSPLPPEIRTPLSGIMGAMSILQTSSLTPDQRELVHISEVCGEQLLLVIDDILDLTKLDVCVFVHKYHDIFFCGFCSLSLTGCVSVFFIFTVRSCLDICCFFFLFFREN